MNRTEKNQSRTVENKIRTLWMLAALALVALIISGCSNAPAETGNSSGSGSNTAPPVETGAGNSAGNHTTVPAKTVTGSSEDNSAATIHAQGIKFAECMRENGVSEFPDPDASGAFTIDAIANGSSLDTSSAAFERAIRACKDLEPPGFTGGGRTFEQQKAALQFAQCIRDNGVKDFPDPANGEPLVDTNRIPSTERNGGMSILNAAMSKCRAFAGAAGVKP